MEMAYKIPKISQSKVVKKSVKVQKMWNSPIIYKKAKDRDIVKVGENMFEEINVVRPVTRAKKEKRGKHFPPVPVHSKVSHYQYRPISSVQLCGPIVPVPPDALKVEEKENERLFKLERSSKISYLNFNMECYKYTNFNIIFPLKASAGKVQAEPSKQAKKDKKRIKSAFADDEAEDEDEMSGNEERDDDDNDSVALEDMPKKTQFKKIVDPDLLSESSNTSDLFNKLDRIRSDAETPTLNQSKLNLTSAPSSNSSFGALISAEPRWTPFQDRISAGTVELTSAENTLQESPTNSQLAKKKLGFEGLFDQTDPDVTDIDDVICLCSGKFVTQDGGMSQAAHMASGKFVTQQNKLPLDISGLAPLDRTKMESIESQDTIILGDGSRPSSRGSTTVETQDTVILTGNVEQNVSNAISSLDKILDLDEVEPETGVSEFPEGNQFERPRAPLATIAGNGSTAAPGGQLGGGRCGLGANNLSASGSKPPMSSQPSVTRLSSTEFRCNLCSQTFSLRSNANKHVKSKHVMLRYCCPGCFKLFSSNQAVSKHQSTKQCDK